MKKLIVLISFQFLFTINVISSELSNLKIIGNERISNNSISQIIEFDNSKKYSLKDINSFQKKLVESEFFSNVSVKLSKNNIIISVKENPLVDFFFIKGILNKKREEFIYNNLSLGNNKIFSEAKLKKDIEFIKSQFLSAGYFDVSVNSEISKNSGNILNLVINVDRKNKYRIKNIFFIGDKVISSKKLYDVVSSSEAGWWKFISSSDLANINRIDYDTSLLKNFYLDNGYFDVQINSSDLTLLSNEYVNVTFSINAGKKYNFGKFEIIDDANNLQSKYLNDIKKILEANIKGTFSRKSVLFSQNLINNYLNKNKVEFINFNVSTEKAKTENNINLKFNFTSGERKFVNLVNIKGNSITEESVIRRSLTFSEGDTLSNFKIIKSEDKIKRTGIFKNVKSKLVNLDKELVNVEIEVEEQPTGSISAGVGVGSSGSAVSTAIAEKNLFGKGVGLSGNISLGTEKISGTVNLGIPDFKNTDNKFNFSLYALETDFTNSGYESKVVGSSISTTFEIYDDFFLNVGGGFDIDKISANNSATALYRSREGTYNSLQTFYAVNFDKRNNIFFPTDGHLIQFGQKLSLPGVSDIPIIRNNLNGSVYHALTDDYVINLKGGITAVNTIDNKDVKLSDRLSLSESKLRGFESFGIGPKSGTDHIGGNYSAYTSIATTFPNPLPDKWRAKSILFVDAGNVWGVDFDKSLDSNKIRSSVGISLDWNSPIGPLSFVLSEVISSADNDIEENFSFKVGSSF